MIKTAFGETDGSETHDSTGPAHNPPQLMQYATLAGVSATSLLQSGT